VSLEEIQDLLMEGEVPDAQQQARGAPPGSDHGRDGQSGL